MTARDLAAGIRPLVCLVWGVQVLAQNSSGGLRGVVEDASGARVASAAVVAEIAGSSRRVISDARGEFRIEGMAPGLWQVTVDADGFASATAELPVAVSAVRDLVVTLRPANVRQTMGVRAAGSSITEQPIDLTSNVHQAVATGQDLQELPLPARSFANIALSGAWH